MKIFTFAFTMALLNSGIIAQGSRSVTERLAASNYLNPSIFAGHKTQSAGDSGGFLGALRLYSSGDYADIPPATQLSPTRITIECWINLEGESGEQTIIDKRDAAGGYNLRVAGNEYPMGLAVVMKGQTEDILSVGGILQAHTWYHIAATFDSVYIRLYLNGNLLDSLASTQGIGNTSTVLRIGEYLGYPSGSFMFHGMIDEVRIWSKALSQAELKSAMSGLLAGTEANLIGYWAFDQRAGSEVVDGSKYNNIGVMVGGAKIVPSTAPVGDEAQNRAVHIDQQGAMAEVPHAPVLSPSHITIECWLKKDSTINTGEYTILDNRGNSSGYNLRLAGTSFPLGLYFAMDGSGTSAIIGSGSCISPYVWYHIAATYDGQTACIYLDGKLIVSQSVTLDISQSTSPLRIGEFLGSPAAHLGIYGNLDELRIWNYGQSQSEIQSDMNRDLSAMETGLVGYWRFNESNGTVAHDKTENENDAALSDGATFVPSEAPVSFVPPAAPVGFRAWGSDNQVVLHWETVPGVGVDHYVIYRRATSNFEPTAEDSIAAVNVSANSYIDVTVTNGARRYYRIKTVDNQNHSSRLSPEVVGKASAIYDDYFTGVYYYPWYSNAWGHEWAGEFVRDYVNPPQAPLLGEYDSRDASVIRQHLDWCKEYGINLWVCSWWGPNSREDTTIRDHIKPELKSDDVKFALFYESGLFGDLPWVIDSSKEAVLKDDFTYIANTYFSHPNYFRINNRPVIFIYLSRLYQGDCLDAFNRIRQSIRILGYELFLIGDEMGSGSPTDHMNFLDAVTAYSLLPNLGYGIDQDFFGPLSGIFNDWEQGAAARGLKFVPDVMPGFNNRKVGMTSPANSLVIPRQSTAGASPTSYYEESINISRPFVDPDLKLIMVTSWNEWHEDTEIEPTNTASPTNKDTSASTNVYTNGYYYDGYGTKFLEVTRDLLARNMSGIEFPVKAYPLRFSLDQNFPNPFNPTTVISYQLPVNSMVTLKVYDVLGREVKTLVSERQAAGTHPVTFDAGNLPSGVYFCRLEVGTYSATKKLLLLK